MVSLEGCKKIGIICEGKKVAIGKPIPIVDSSTNDVVDYRMVMEVYKNIMSSRELVQRCCPVLNLAWIQNALCIWVILF